MDAVEDLAGLDDPVGFAPADAVQRIASRPVNAGKAEDVEGQAPLAAKGGPGGFRLDARHAAFRFRLGGGFLVGPGALKIAVNADGREIARPAQPRRGRQRMAVCGKRRIASFPARFAGECA